MKRGDIFSLYLHTNSGSVQSGRRPVIIISNNTGNRFSKTIIVCSITSADKKSLPTHLDISTNGGLKKPSIVLCEQILTVNKSDLKQYIGTVTDKRILNRLNKCIQLSLGINNTEE